MTVNLSAFVPAYRLISDISQALQAVVTFDEAHTYTPGEILSFRVSPNYGMFQMNNVQGIVISTTNLTVTMDINSLSFDAFVTPASPGAYPAMAVPAGSGIIPGSRPATVNLEDAFDNVPET
jgi:hypothetical protein